MKTFFLILGAVFATATANAIQLRDISMDEAPACIQELLAQLDLDKVIGQIEADLEPFKTTGVLDVNALLGHVMIFEQEILGNQEILKCLQSVADQYKLTEIDLVCISNKIHDEDLHELMHYFDQFITLYHEHGLEFKDVMDVIGAIQNFILNETTLGECIQN